MKIEVLEEDIENLEFLVKKYTKEKNFEKAHQCMDEIERLKRLIDEQTVNK